MKVINVFKFNNIEQDMHCIASALLLQVYLFFQQVVQPQLQLHQSLQSWWDEIVLFSF